MFERTKALCDSFLKRGLPGFDLSVYKGGECILRYMGGYSDLENKVPINGKERYNIYSCSKVITCTAALLLYEKGLFSLEDKLSLYMPEFSEMTVKTEDGVATAKKPILIKHLFEMTAGFSYNCFSDEIKAAKSETDGRCPTREVMKYLAKTPLLFDPGERWEYSLCHDVLAALVEVISGERFCDFVRKNIFEPLGMNDTTFALPDEELSTLCEQYKFIDGKPQNVGRAIVSYKFGSEYNSGGAGCISTVDDYMRFLEGLRTYKILKPETVALMATDRLTDEQKRTYWTKETHGYGLGVRCSGIHEKYRDFGWGGAACASLAIDVENEISLYFGAHLLSSPVAGERAKLYRLVKAELIDEDDLKYLEEELQAIKDYNLTY